jgi:hypothetical protein
VRTSANGASPIKTRRTQAEMAALRQGLYDIVAAQRPMTVRITGVIDPAALARHRTSEAAERESLDRFVEAWSGERP